LGQHLAVRKLGHFELRRHGGVHSINARRVGPTCVFLIRFPKRIDDAGNFSSRVSRTTSTFAMIVACLTTISGTVSS
jgi:hypothetical protein